MNEKIQQEDDALASAAEDAARRAAKWAALGQRVQDALSTDAGHALPHTRISIGERMKQSLDTLRKITGAERKNRVSDLQPYLKTLRRRLDISFDWQFEKRMAQLLPVAPQALHSLAAADSTASPVLNEDELSEQIARAVQDAVAGISQGFEPRQMARLIKAEVSREIAADVRNRRWTS